MDECKPLAGGGCTMGAQPEGAAADPHQCTPPRRRRRRRRDSIHEGLPSRRCDSIAVRRQTEVAARPASARAPTHAPRANHVDDYDNYTSDASATARTHAHGADNFNYDDDSEEEEGEEEAEEAEEEEEEDDFIKDDDFSAAAVTAAANAEYLHEMSRKYGNATVVGGNTMLGRQIARAEAAIAVAAAARVRSHTPGASDNDDYDDHKDSSAAAAAEKVHESTRKDRTAAAVGNQTGGAAAAAAAAARVRTRAPSASNNDDYGNYNDATSPTAAPEAAGEEMYAMTRKFRAATAVVGWCRLTL